MQHLPSVRLMPSSPPSERRSSKESSVNGISYAAADSTMALDRVCNFTESSARASRGPFARKPCVVEQTTKHETQDPEREREAPPRPGRRGLALTRSELPEKETAQQGRACRPRAGRHLAGPWADRRLPKREPTSRPSTETRETINPLRPMLRSTEAASVSPSPATPELGSGPSYQRPHYDGPGDAVCNGRRSRGGPGFKTPKSGTCAAGRRGSGAACWRLRGRLECRSLVPFLTPVTW